MQILLSHLKELHRWSRHSPAPPYVLLFFCLKMEKSSALSTNLTDYLFTLQSTSIKKRKNDHKEKKNYVQEERKESRQAHEEKRACKRINGFFPLETQRNTLPEIHIRTTASDHASTENALQGHPERHAAGRLHHRSGQKQIQTQQPRHRNDRNLPAQKQRKEFLHPRRRRRPDIHRRTKLRTRHEQR